MYQNSLYLDDPVGNNAFAYDHQARTRRSLFIPSVIDGNFSDIRPGTEIVFADVDETGILQECVGLEHFVRLTYAPPGPERLRIPMIVFDNHNHALAFWYEALHQEIIGEQNTLVHIDEHSDLWENEHIFTPFHRTLPPPYYENRRENTNQSHISGKREISPLYLNNPMIPHDLPEKLPRNTIENFSQGSYGKHCKIPSGSERHGKYVDLGEVFHFTNYECHVGNYIQPAIRAGLIEKVLRIEDTIGMEKYALYERGEQESFILNLDLDFFAPEMDYIPFEDKKRVILHFARQASLITIATSPFFIDQSRAIEVLGRVFEFYT